MTTSAAATQERITLGKTFDALLALVHTIFTRTIKITDNSLQSLEHGSQIINDATTVAAHSSSTWKQASMHEKTKELEEVLAKINASTT